MSDARPIGFEASCNSPRSELARAAAVHTSPGTFAALRLGPGDDLLDGLAAACTTLGTQAAALVTCVGSLTHAHLRFADRDDTTHIDGPLEIVALVGTLDPGGRHLHLTVADAEGRVTAGHLMPDAPIRTTAEIVLVALEDLTFGRATCPRSGYRELTID